MEVIRAVVAGGALASGATRKNRMIGLPGKTVFVDKGHMEYYYSSSRSPCEVTCAAAGIGKIKKKKDSSQEKQAKRRLKGLVASDMGFRLDDLGLQEWSTNAKEIKRKKKEEKIKMKTELDCETLSSSSSSSSSESSDSDSDCEYGEVASNGNCCQSVEKVPSALHPEKSVLPGNLLLSNKLQATDPHENLVIESTAEAFQENLTREKDFQISSMGVVVEQGCSSYDTGKSSRLDSETSLPPAGKEPFAEEPTKKIEVCMGGKCRKSGAALLLEEFQRAIGIEGAVSGCKCMGECKKGPNVRILSSQVAHSPTAVGNLLCIGVGLEDVTAISAKFLGGSGLATAS